MRVCKGMNENSLVDSFFFRFILFLSYILFLFYLHFCLLIHFEIIICIVKSLIFNFNASVWQHKPVHGSPKCTEYVTGICNQTTMFHVNLNIPPPHPTPQTLPLSNLISLFYAKIRVVWTLPLTLAKGASTKNLQPA